MRQLQIRTAVAAMTGIIAALSAGPICAPPISRSDLRATSIYQLVWSARHLVFQMKCRERRGDIISLCYKALCGGRKFIEYIKIKETNNFSLLVHYTIKAYLGSESRTGQKTKKVIKNNSGAFLRENIDNKPKIYKNWLCVPKSPTDRLR